ncbi:MAG: DUF924 domain-containing protein [Elainella sp. Prado103]|nr:DUF924 domain-containing protein [Elainella sp. Prado103]
MDDQPIQEILQFWFSTGEEATYDRRCQVWFGKQPELDAAIQRDFQDIYTQAAAGQLNHWRHTPQGCLALILLLDQFSRNMFRDTPQAFATDPQARQVAQFAVEQGYDQQLLPIERIFVYLPFEHSEDLTDQQRSVDLFQALTQTAPDLIDVYDYALRHQRVIQQFGRFPHRNRILERASTAAEIEFLKQPGSAF